MKRNLRVATYNIHKGLSFFKRRMVIHELRERLRALDVDLVFLQEVLGNHERYARRHHDWPASPQYEFLADSVWQQYAYGRNAVYDFGHHGNAVLSRYPIARWDNQDVSTHRFERRGLLHCEIGIPNWDEPLHCICVHLGLFARGRSRQIEWLRQRIEKLVPREAPLIVAGDFNDWRLELDRYICGELGFSNALGKTPPESSRTWHARRPVFSLDRIYTRNLKVASAGRFEGDPWSELSDHLPLYAELQPG